MIWYQYIGEHERLRNLSDAAVKHNLKQMDQFWITFP